MTNDLLLTAALLAASGLGAEPGWGQTARMPTALPAAEHDLGPPVPAAGPAALAVRRAAGCQPVGWLARRLPQRATPHVGRGKPLVGTSWLNRPYYAGWYAGQWYGDPLISRTVYQEDGLFAGYLLGCDLNHYWGSELRLSLSYIDIEHEPGRRAAGSTRNVLGDVHLLYYPWGDARWRPFVTAGIGLTGYHFIAPENQAVDQTVFALPWGVGVKYQFRRWMALRLDWKDNLTFGSGAVETMNNWSLTGGVEVHWGPQTSRRYYPW